MPPSRKFFQTSTPFQNGEFVKTLADIYGVVQPYDPSRHPTNPKSPGRNGPPGAMMNEKVKIPKGEIGEVLYSDETRTIVIFPIHETGRLQPALVKAEGFTYDFQPVTRNPKVNPFIWLAPRRVKYKGKPLSEQEKHLKPFIGKWKINGTK